MGHKIYITGCAGIPARYGGFETFAEQISKELINNFDICISCSTRFYDFNERESLFNGIKRKFIDLNANGIQSLLYDFKSIYNAAGKADIIFHLGGGAGIIFLLLKPFIKGNIWIHTDGLEWKRKKWNFLIRVFLRISVFLSYCCSNKIIIDNQALVEKVPGLFRKKVTFTGYGGDHLPSVERTSDKNDYALAICRAEPENNLHILLEAFKKLKNRQITVISNWDKTHYGRLLYKSYNNCSNIKLLDAIYNNPVQLQEYRANSSLYLHGHSAGGTNPSLVEAMFTGIPVIAHDNPFNRATTKNSALYFRSIEDIISIINSLNTEQLSEISEKMRSIAQNEYLWKNVAGSLISEIKSIPVKQ